jgi:hypothetical protein
MPKIKTNKKIETNISLPDVNIMNDDIFAKQIYINYFL